MQATESVAITTHQSSKAGFTDPSHFELSAHHVQRIYGRGAASYDAVMAAGWRSLIDRRKIVTFAEQGHTEQIVELGIGTGLNVPFYERPELLTGVDFTPGMLMVAFRKHGNTVRELKEVDACHTGLPSETYGGTVATLVLSAAPDPLGILREAYRITCSGGRLSILDVSRSPIEEVVNVQRSLVGPYSTTTGFPRPCDDYPDGVIVYRPDIDILGLVEQAGWIVERSNLIDTQNPFTCRVEISAKKP